jgi:hypothetical protein
MTGSVGALVLLFGDTHAQYGGYNNWQYGEPEKEVQFRPLIL